MGNNQAAEAIRNMDSKQQGQVKNALLGLVFKCLAVLALLGVAGVFLSMQDFESERAQYVEEGTVSKALVLGTSADEYTLTNKHGDTAKASKNFVRIAHDTKSAVTYAQLGKSVKEAELPVPQAGAEYTASIDMDDAEFARVKSGDTLTVVTSPYNTGSPWTLSKVRDYSAHGYYLWMAIFGALSVILWVIGRVVSRR